MKNFAKKMGILSLWSLILIVIFAALHLYTNNDLYKEIMTYASIPFAVILSYSIVCISLFGFQLKENNTSVPDKIIGFSMISLVTFVAVPVLFLMLDKGLGFLNTDIFYQLTNSGRLVINDNARLCALGVASVFFLVNLISTRYNKLINRLPLFNEA